MKKFIFLIAFFSVASLAALHAQTKAVPAKMTAALEAAEHNPDIVVNKTADGQLSFQQKSVCSTSGHVSYKDVEYCTKSKGWKAVQTAATESVKVNKAPAKKCSPAEKAACKKAGKTSCKGSKGASKTSAAVKTSAAAKTAATPAKKCSPAEKAACKKAGKTSCKGSKGASKTSAVVKTSAAAKTAAPAAKVPHAGCSHAKKASTTKTAAAKSACAPGCEKSCCS